jgi:polyphosphate kinase
VEIAFPVEQEDIKRRLIRILELSQHDTVKVRIQNKDGSYRKLDKRGKDFIESQRIFYEQASEIIQELELDEQKRLD